MSSAFRNLGTLKKHWKYMILKARHPVTLKWFYFVDKCLPFGAAISCAVFQKFSNAISFLVQKRSGKKNVNYLDDYLFIALMKWLCNQQTEIFMEICEKICFPVAIEKTIWASTRLVFLGLLINTILQMVFVLIDKLIKGRNMVERILNCKSGKTTVHELQQLCGFLNFLGCAVVPGRAFTQRLYCYTKNPNMRKHHHVRVNQEIRGDLETWRIFLYHDSALAPPFLDFSGKGCVNAKAVNMYSDASGNFFLCMGALCGSSWISQQWQTDFCEKVKPSIEYLELFGVLTGVTLWIHRFRNKRIILFCDNMSVVNMINNSSSTCKNCMVLFRLLVLKGLVENVRMFARHVKGRANELSDALSRMQVKKFWQLAEEKKLKFEESPHQMPDELWPMSKLWIKC